MDKDKMKKLLIITGSVLVVVVILIVVFSMISGQKNIKLNYKEAEEKIKEVAIEYYKEHSNLLPKEGNSREISVDDLVKLELMKPLDEIIIDSNNCTGKITVKNVNNTYSYIPYIKCGNDYVTSELYKKVIDDNTVVETGNGLYLQNENYVFRGENIKNYVKLSDKIWRIVSIDPEGNIKLILNDSLNESVAWDDRYNGDKRYTSGINDYTVSRLKDKLESIYKSDELLDKDSKGLVVSKNYCISGITSDGSSSYECEKYIENVNIGLLNVYEYTNASIDSKCQKITDRECQNYNYLNSNGNSRDWWTFTPNKENTYEVFYIESYGTVDIKTCSSNASLKPVIYISKDIMYDSGTGDESKPYIVK